MNHFKLRKNSPAVPIVSIILALAVIRFVSSLLVLFYEETLISYLYIFLVLYGIAALVCVILLVRMRSSQRMSQDSNITYTPLFGPDRELSYSELQKLSMGGRTYVLYTMDGRKLVKFNDLHTDNASEIVAFLKSKGVKTEI